MPCLATHRARLVLLAALPALLAATAHAQSWPWFAEPFSVRVATVHRRGPVDAGAFELP
jgi:hypothetical protein